MMPITATFKEYLYQSPKSPHNGLVWSIFELSEPVHGQTLLWLSTSRMSTVVQYISYEEWAIRYDDTPERFDIIRFNESRPGYNLIRNYLNRDGKAPEDPFLDQIKNLTVDLGYQVIHPEFDKFDEIEIEREEENA